jgi:hypothetical protein
MGVGEVGGVRNTKQHHNCDILFACTAGDAATVTKTLGFSSTPTSLRLGSQDHQ